MLNELGRVEAPAHEIGQGRLHPRLILPVVPGVRVTTGLPPCQGLRGEPCRTYVRYVNRSHSL